MERRTSNAEDVIKEIDSLVKENAKSNNLLTQYICNTMKRPNLRIIGIEREDFQLKGT